MISLSHWGMFPVVYAHSHIEEWLNYDSGYLHGCYQHLNFGPRLA